MRQITKYRSLVDIFSEDQFLDQRGITFIEAEGETVLTYRELYQQALQTLHILQEHGIEAGDELVVQLEKNQDLVQVLWASLLGGMVPVFIPLGKQEDQKAKLSKIWGALNRPFLLTTQEVDQKYQILQNEIIDPEHLAEMGQKHLKIDDLPETTQYGVIGNGQEDDPAVMMFSSGSTGDPKGIILTHHNLLSIIAGMIEASNATPEDIYFSWTPLTHILGLSGFHFVPFFVQSNQYLMATELFLTNPQSWFAKAHELKASILSSPNFGYKYFLDFFQPESAQDWDLSAVRAIFNIAEPISADLCNDFLDRLAPYGLKRTTMLPCYGMTETGLIITMKPDGEEFAYYSIDRRTILIGNPVQDVPFDNDHSAVFVDVGAPANCCQVRICDEQNQILGENIVGYIQAKGANVIQEYYQNPEANQKSFTPDGWLITGDVGFIRNGRVVITGRSKNIIFVNGVNYFPHDIERVALGVPGVEEGKVAVCGVTDSEARGEKIIAFVVGEPEGDLAQFAALATELKKHISKKMGLELAHVLPVLEIPKTRSGKIQRYKLGDQYQAGGFATLIEKINLHYQDDLHKKEVGRPTTPTEAALVRIWSEVFGLDQERIGIEDHFIELGGNSLKAGSVSYQVHKELQVRLQIRQLFAMPILRELAEYIDQAQISVYTSIQVIPEQTSYPATSVQKRLYSMSHLEGDQTSYNLPYLMTIRGELDQERFVAALQKIVARHESLRTSFHMRAGELMQQVHPEVEFEVQVLTDLTDTNLEGVICQFIRPFDLSQAPLIRAQLVQVVDHYVFMFDMHHIISDGSSIGIFMDELIRLYQGEDLPELTIQYKDYSAWLEELLSGEAYREQEAYWLSQFADEIPVLNLPTDYPRPMEQSFAGKTVIRELSPELTAQINQLIKDEDSSMFMVLVAALNLLLANYTSQDDILLGTAVAARSHSDLEQLIGMFVNTLAMRTQVDASLSFSQFLAQVRENSLKAYEHQDYQFEDLVEKLQVQRTQGRNPLIDVVFVLENADIMQQNVAGLQFDPIRYRNPVAKFDLTVYAYETADQLRMEFEYSTDLFKEATIQRMIGHLAKILQDVVTHPEITLAEIDMTSEEEKLQILHQFNDTTVEYPREKTIQELFEAVVEQYPERVAVTFEGQSLTYQELNAKANQLARQLRVKGVQPDQIVGVLSEKSLEMIISVLAIVKAGGAYLPIDIDYPANRVEYMLADTEAALLLIQPELMGVVTFTGEMINLEDHRLYQGDATNLEPLNRPEDMIYVIYTSGSTGKPKGVMVTHGNVNRLISNSNMLIIQPEDRIMQTGSLAFDASTFEIWGSLLNGASLHLIVKDDLLSAERFEARLKENGITMCWLTAPLFNQLLEENPAIFSELQTLYVGGDALSPKHIQQVRKSNPALSVVNGYGPTESTTFTTYFRVERDYADNIPIGQPVANTQVYILDRYNRLQPVGVPGELCIGGDGLALGYLKQPELTAEKFVPKVIQHLPELVKDQWAEPVAESSQPERLYRTGDLVRWLPDGNIEFLGRIDHQVKIRGFRIELGEIENQLVKHPEVKEAIVLDQVDQQGKKYLCAYFTALREMSVAELREHLFTELPDYMIPSYFIQLEVMPLTSNGKVDRRELPEPDASLMAKREYVAPTTEAEATLAQLWANVLGIEQVGVTDNFFELGGDSIKAIQILARAKEAGITLTVKEVFKYKTIAKLLQNVDYAKEVQTISQAEVVGEIGLTPIQHWFFDQHLKHEHYFNQTNLFTLKNDVDLNLLEQAFQRLIAHHDGLRICYRKKAGQVEQYNRKIDEVDFNLQVIDLSAEPYSVQQEKLRQLSEEVQDALDLENDLLMQVRVFDLGAQGKRLLIAIHHLIIDGVSWRVLTEDLERLYTSNLQKELLAKTTSFQEWSQRLADYALSDHVEIGYWEKIDPQRIQPVVTGEVTDNLLRDHQEVLLELDPEQTELLLTKANWAYNTEINDLLLSALTITCTEALGTDHLFLNLEGHGREEIIDGVDLTRTIGWFTSAFPVYFSHKKSIEQTISHVKDNLRRIPDKGIHYGIARYLGRGSQLAKLRPEISFNYLGQFDDSFSSGAGAEGRLLAGCQENPGMYFHLDNQHSYLIDLNGMVVDGKLTITLSYNAKWIAKELVEQIHDLYLKNLREIISHCLDQDTQSVTVSDLGVEDRLDEDDLDAISQLYSFTT